MANKQIGFNVGLNEIETMTPEQAYLFKRELQKAVRQLENIQ